jgi:hypothetical protein
MSFLEKSGFIFGLMLAGAGFGFAIGAAVVNSDNTSSFKKVGAVERCVKVRNQEICELICPSTPSIQETRK